MKRTLLKSSSRWLHLSSRISSRTKISLGDSTCTIWIFLEPWGGHKSSTIAISNLLRILGTIVLSFSIFCVVFVSIWFDFRKFLDFSMFWFFNQSDQSLLLDLLSFLAVLTKFCLYQLDIIFKFLIGSLDHEITQPSLSCYVTEV